MRSTFCLIFFFLEAKEKVSLSLLEHIEMLGFKTSSEELF